MTKSEKRLAYITAARNAIDYVCDDGGVDNNAEVSFSDDGAYVQCWLWIPKEDLEDGD